MENHSTRPRLGTVLSRVARKRCPQCGESPAFRAWGRLKPACEACGRQFERLSGSSTGTMQVGGMITVFFAIAAWFMIRAATDWSIDASLIAMLAASAVFSVWFFPYAKLIWEAIDYLIDSSGEGNT